MNIIKVINLLNDLKVQQKIKDYSIFGAVAATYYMESIYTEDIDILILTSNDSEYITAWNELKKYAQLVIGFGFKIHGTEVQLFSTAGHPLFEDSLKTAKRVRLEKTFTRVVDREHLILLFLTSNRQKDRFKASVLLENSDTKYLNHLLRKFDKNDTLKKRIASILR